MSCTYNGPAGHGRQAEYTGMTRSRDDILRDIAREEARLSELDRLREEARARIAALKSELEATTFSHPLFASG